MVLTLLWRSCRTWLRIYLVLGFSLLVGFWGHLLFHCLKLICLNCVRPPDSVWVDHMSLEICWCLWDFLFCWSIDFQNNCYYVLHFIGSVVIFHFSSWISVIWNFSLLFISVAKVLLILFFQRANFLFCQFFQLFILFQFCWFQLWF